MDVDPLPQCHRGTEEFILCRRMCSGKGEKRTAIVHGVRGEPQPRHFAVNAALNLEEHVDTMHRLRWIAFTNSANGSRGNWELIARDGKVIGYAVTHHPCL
jgi:hypothetical protein